MRNEIYINGEHAILPPPSKDSLKRHANFLKNHCNVPLGHALQMVAYFHDFSKWDELISRPPEPQDKLALILMEKVRKNVQAHRDAMPKRELLKLTKLNASIGTLTRAVEDDSILKLNDYDIIQLHNHLNEEVAQGQIVSYSFSEALSSAEHCIVLIAKLMAIKGNSKTINPHLYFPWFSFRMYGYLHVNGNTLNYDCRELDSYLYPSLTEYKVIFNRPWFVNYVTGFIRTILQSLNDSGYKGYLAFGRVCNEGLIERMVTLENGSFIYNKRYSLAKNQTADETISKLIDTMLAMGASKDEEKQKLVFSYGNGEKY